MSVKGRIHIYKHKYFTSSLESPWLFVFKIGSNMQKPDFKAPSTGYKLKMHQ